MARLRRNIEQAISDFNDIEIAIEECGIDVPYDEDTCTYGDKIRAIYAKGKEEGSNAPLVYNAETHYEFPSVGDERVIYKAQSEKLLYQWNQTDFKYEVLGSMSEIETVIDVIDGGNASGDKNT